MVSLHGSIHIRLSASLCPEGSNIGHLETWASGKTGSPVMIVRHSVLHEEEAGFGCALQVTTGPALDPGSISHLL